MKKMITMLLLALLLVTQAVPAMAEEVTQITITASTTEAKPGDEVTFTVTIDSVESCRYYGLILEYDPAVYEMGSGECTAKGAMFSAFDPERGFVVLHNKERVPEGTVGTFKMKVKEGAVSGNTEISGISSVKTGDEAKASAVTGAKVKVNGAAASTPETTAPKPTTPQPTTPKPTTPKPTTPKPTDPTKPAATKPTETQAAEEPPVTEAETLPVPETIAETTEATVQATVEETTVAAHPEEAPAAPEETKSVLPVIAIGAAAACVVLVAVMMIKKRKK